MNGLCLFFVVFWLILNDDGDNVYPLATFCRRYRHRRRRRYPENCINIFCSSSSSDSLIQFVHLGMCL